MWKRHVQGMNGMWPCKHRGGCRAIVFLETMVTSQFRLSKCSSGLWASHSISAALFTCFHQKKVSVGGKIILPFFPKVQILSFVVNKFSFTLLHFFIFIFPKKVPVLLPSYTLPSYMMAENPFCPFLSHLLHFFYLSALSNPIINFWCRDCLMLCVWTVLGDSGFWLSILRH